MMNNILLVARREIRQILAMKSFWLTLLILPVALALGPILGESLDDNEPMRIAVVDRSGGAAAAALKARFFDYGGDRPVIALAIKWCEDHLPAPADPVLVHGDYRMGNIMVDADGLAAVLDWELCTLGDPIADLTYFLMMWRMPPGERIAMDTVDFATSGIPTMEQALDRYLSATGRQLDRPIEWYIAFNLFRLAAILQGVAGRAARGQANNERALRAQDRVEPLAQTAWDNALRAGAGS